MSLIEMRGVVLDYATVMAHSEDGCAVMDWSLVQGRGRLCGQTTGARFVVLFAHPFSTSDMRKLHGNGALTV